MSEDSTLFDGDITKDTIVDAGTNDSNDSNNPTDTPTDIPVDESAYDKEIDDEIQKLVTGHFNPKQKKDPTPVLEKKLEYVKELTMSYLDGDSFKLALKTHDYIVKIIDETYKSMREHPDETGRFTVIVPGYAHEEAKWLLRMASILVTVARRVDRDALIQKLVQNIVYLDVDLMVYFIDNMFTEAEDLGMFLFACRILGDAWVLSVNGDPKHLCMKASTDIYASEHPLSSQTSTDIPSSAENLNSSAQ